MRLKAQERGDLGPRAQWKSHASNPNNQAGAKAAGAKAADVAIVFVGTLSHEGGDRDSLSLDDGGPEKNQVSDKTPLFSRSVGHFSFQRRYLSTR